MAIYDDFSLNYTTKKISHASGSTRYTVNALYSWLMDLFDDASQMDDTVPMSAQTPTEYTLINGWTFNADSDLGYLYGGSIVDTTANNIWANFYTLGTIVSGGVVYVYQNGSLVTAPPGYSSGHVDQLIKVTSSGSDVDSKNVTAYVRDIGNTFDNFTAAGTSTGGRVPIPLATNTDSNDDGAGTGMPLSGVTITIGATSQDIGDGNGSQPYGVIIDGNGNTCANVYKHLKYVVSKAHAAGAGSFTTLGYFYRYLDGSYTETKQAPFATFAGGKIFGARGVWITNVSDSNNRVLIDGNGVTRTPPTTISITVSGVVSGDRVLVARSSGGVINKSQFTLNGTHTSTSTVTVNEALGADIPDSGALRLGDTAYTYSGITRGSKQFTGVSPALSGASGADLYQPYIDGVASGTSMTKSLVYASDFDIIARVRKKGILPFENTGTVTVSGASISAIRTTDTIAV